MNKRYLTVALSGITLALTFFGASADQSAGWYYDEGRDTIVFTVEGSRTGIASSRVSTPLGLTMTEQDATWYYDE